MMKNHLTKLPFLARATRAAGAGFKGWVNTLAGRRDRPRRAPAPRPPRAKRDEAEAMNVLGLLHIKCRGIPCDYAQARHWFQKAATAGSTAAMHNMGAMYEHGHGVAQDYAQARGWYRRAAEAGNAPASERLSRLAARLPQTGQLSTIQAPVGHRRVTPRNNICSLESASTTHRSEPRESLAPC
jgi:TPR repeat protein